MLSCASILRGAVILVLLVVVHVWLAALCSMLQIQLMLGEAGRPDGPCKQKWAEEGTFGGNCAWALACEVHKVMDWLIGDNVFEELLTILTL